MAKSNNNRSSELKINCALIIYSLCFVGDDLFNYSVVLFNLYVNAFYWAFGLTLVVMEILNRPKYFHQYKIQQDRDTLSNKPKMVRVSFIPTKNLSLWCDDKTFLVSQ